MNAKQHIRVAVLMMATVVSLASARAATTYSTKSSGDWNSPATWDDPGIPVHDGAETVNIQNGHVVTNDGANAEWYTLNVGSTTGGALSGYFQTGGTLTSERLTEIGCKPSRTGANLMSLKNVDAQFKGYRLVLGRDNGNSTLRMKGGSLTIDGQGSDGKNPVLMMGIDTKPDAVPNRLELEDVAWTNKMSNLQIGYQSAGTNIVHLANSSLYTTKALSLGTSAFTSDATSIGQDFFVAENSDLTFSGSSVCLPYGVRHSAHLTLSNSTLSCTQLLLGNVEGTTNYLEFIDCPPIVSSTKSWMGYMASTCNHILFKDLKAPKGTGSEVYAPLYWRSVAPGSTGEGTRWFNLVFDNCDWSSTSEFVASDSYNIRTVEFRNMSVLNVPLTAGGIADAPGTLVLSNFTWSAAGKTLGATTVYRGAGIVRAYDSTLSGSGLTICNDQKNNEDQDYNGEVLLSGGTAEFSGDVIIRRGRGALTLERGAKMSCGRCYFPNMTGAKATVVISDGSELTVTNNLIIGSQVGTFSDLTIKSGGRLALGPVATVSFGKEDAQFILNMEGGELDLRGRAAGFATQARSVGVAYLKGGIVKAKGFGTPPDGASQKIVFDGGIVQPTVTCTLTEANSQTVVADGGAIIDVADGLTATVSSVLSHDEGANETDGGLVKRGAGVLSLNAVSTYTGPTTLEAGVLKLAVADALGSKSIVCKGGSLAVAKGVGYPDGLSFDVSGLPYAAGAKFVIATGWTGAAPTIVGLPSDWKVKLCPNGDVAVVENLGLLLLVR